MVEAPHEHLLSGKSSVREASASLLETTEPWPCWVALVLFLGVLYLYMSVVFSWVLNLWLNNFASVCVFLFLTLHGFGLCSPRAQHQTFFFFFSGRAELRSESPASQIQALSDRQRKAWAPHSITISSSLVTLCPSHQHQHWGSWAAILDRGLDPVRSNYSFFYMDLVYS